MQKPPEQIIAEFESRRIEEKKSRRKKFVRRAIDSVQFGVMGLGAVFFMTWRGGASSQMGVLLVCVYLMNELQKRWAIEDELKRLEDERRKTA